MISVTEDDLEFLILLPPSPRHTVRSLSFYSELTFVRIVLRLKTKIHTQKKFNSYTVAIYSISVVRFLSSPTMHSEAIQTSSLASPPFPSRDVHSTAQVWWIPEALIRDAKQVARYRVHEERRA